MLQIADAPNKTRDEILFIDVDTHVRRLEQGPSNCAYS